MFHHRELKMSKKLLLAISVLLILGLWAARFFQKKDISKDSATITKVASPSYFTCPMHPQVHMDHQGECPICHMKLVKVEKNIEQTTTQSEGEKRTSVSVTDEQLHLIGVQKVEVEKMNLQLRIPVSGRVISTTAVAFQVYEADLRAIRVGLPFRGEESVNSEELSGVISSVDSFVDPSSRTVRVTGTITNGPQSLLSETSFRGEIQISFKDRLGIPESSVLHTGSGKLIYKVENENKLTPIYIKLGVKAEGFYEVISGLSEGDFISSGPNFLIDSEAKIRGAND
jgi:multidrug efflux pump subunit AcrA (membrane-fusion protein)